MNIKSYKFLIIAAITFVILFLMNFIGNHDVNKVNNALLVAGSGVVGLTIGMRFIYGNKKDDTYHDFD